MSIIHPLGPSYAAPGVSTARGTDARYGLVSQATYATVQSQLDAGKLNRNSPNRSQFESVSRDTPALSTIKPPAIPPLTSRDIRVAAAVTLSPLIEFACVLIGLAMAVPLAAVVWAVGP